MTAMDDHPFASRFVTAPDGLRLHVRERGPRASEALPVLCLPGLARTGADFDALAAVLARGTAAAPPRRVVALDYRGRGRSDYDRNPANYTLAVELADLDAVLTALELLPCVAIGTSRGGLLVMLLAALRPTALAGAVLNDIGPVIEPAGLLRIKGYVGRLPQPATFEEGAEILQRLFGAQFPKLAREEWIAFAARTWRQSDSGLVPDYDPALARALAGPLIERPPALWDQFDALANVPLMVIRGANSDVLAAETVAAMRARRGDLVVREVPDQGHAPLLAEPEVIEDIAAFVAACERARGVDPS